MITSSCNSTPVTGKLSTYRSLIESLSSLSLSNRPILVLTMNAIISGISLFNSHSVVQVTPVSVEVYRNSIICKLLSITSIYYNCYANILL